MHSPITDSFSYRTESGERLRQQLRATMPAQEYWEEQMRAMHTHCQALIREIPMLTLQQRENIGVIDERHTVVLTLDGRQYIPAFQYDDLDLPPTLKQNVIRMNEELAVDISPWDAIQMWNCSRNVPGIWLRRPDGGFSRICPIDLVDASYDLLTKIMFDGGMPDPS